MHIRQIGRERIAYHSIVLRELLILAVKMLTGHFVLLRKGANFFSIPI
ncbi:hypothetical protein DOT_1038 [Desulfosporosinus sp. OT]|nr:hypothetical protein DOT_1038 [Desulfosporosinus sp. OT]